MTLMIVVYGATAAPTVTGGDAGELLLVADQLAVAHPPGYPLYTLLAHLFAGLFSTTLEGVHALSVLCGAGAVGVLYVAFVDVANHRPSSAAAALAFGGIGVVWQHATDAEVFALHHLLLAMLLWRTVRLVRLPSTRSAFGLAVVAGLSLSHHHTSVFWVGTAFVVAVQATLSHPDRRRLWTTALVGVVVGLLPHLLFVATGDDVTLASHGAPSTWAGFVHHLLRRDYGTFQLVGGGAASSWSSRVGAMALHQLWAVCWVGAPFVVSGVVLLWRLPASPAGRVGRAFTVASGIYLIAFSLLANIDVEAPLLRSVFDRFQAPVTMTTLLAFAVGTSHAGQMTSTTLRRVGVVALAVIAVAPWARHVGDIQQRNQPVLDRFARAVVDELPPNAVLWVRGDLASNTIRYVHHVERVRPDVVVLDQELLTRAWYVERARALHPELSFSASRYHPRASDGFSLATFVVNNADRAVFVFPDVKEGDRSLDEDHVLVPVGFSQVVLPAAAVATAASWATGQGLQRWTTPLSTEPTPWQQEALHLVFDSWHRRGVFLLKAALASNDDDARQKLLLRARDALERARSLATQPPPAALLKNLGLVHARLAPTSPQSALQAIADFAAYLDVTTDTESATGDGASYSERAAIQAALDDLRRRHAGP